jgi:hypothetical protein
MKMQSQLGYEAIDNSVLKVEGDAFLVITDLKPLVLTTMEIQKWR